MPFPFTIDGRVDLPVTGPTGDQKKQILTLVGNLIVDLKPRHIQRDGNQIKFYGNVFRIAWISNWNHLAMVGHSVISVRSDSRGITIAYELGVVTWFAFTTIITLAGGAFAAIMPGETFSRIVLFPIGMWLLLFVGNYMIALMRFRSLLRQAIRATSSIDEPTV